MLGLFADDIKKFIKAHSRAVIATVAEDGQPYTSVIFYVVDSDEAIYFLNQDTHQEVR